MKSINDFKIIDGIAILKGISFVEEQKIVDEFLKEHQYIQYAKVVSEDNRFFKLQNNRLILSSEETFINPYYNNENITIDVFNDQPKSLDARIEKLEEKQELLLQVLVSFIGKIR